MPPPARSARAPRRASAPRRHARPRARPRVLAGGRAGIRWDRVSRVALLAVLVILVCLYAGPARSYWRTMHEAKLRRAEVGVLKRENERLRARRQMLRSPSALEREARRLGMTKPGERPYVVEHLPKGP